MKLTPINTEERKALEMRTGDTVRVWQKVRDKEGKTRLQAFEGLLIARKHGRESGATFTIRRIASGVGVERIFPLYSPMIDRIEIIRRSKTRRSKLYYVREKTAKEIRRKMKMLADFVPAEPKKVTVVLPETKAGDAKGEEGAEIQEKEMAQEIK